MEISLFNNTKSPNTNLSPFIHPVESPTVLNGWTLARKLGAIVQDTGYEIVDAQIQASKPITGLYNFIQQSGTEKMLATVDDSTSDDTQLFYKTSAGSWTEIAAAETAWVNVAGAKVEMVGFIGYCFFAGYSETDGFLPVASLTGTTFSTSTNVTSMPQAKYLVKYRDRLYALNVKYGGTHYPFRIVASGVPSAGAISWSTSGAPTSSSGGFLDVDFQYDITGGAENWDRMVVFTDFSAYFYDQSSFKKVWDTGCSAHRTIKTSGAYMLWANSDGVWVSTGGQPQCISGEVEDFIVAGDSRNFFAEIVDEVYHLFVGNVTVNGFAYSNLVLKFNIKISTWEWREYYSTFTAFARYKESGRRRLYMGDSVGYVWNKGKHTDSTLISQDAQISGSGQPVACNFELAPLIIGSAGKTKRIKSITAYAERAQGLTLFSRIIDKNTRAPGPYIELGKLNKYINTFDVNVPKGTILQLAGSINGKLPYASFYGVTLDVEQESSLPKKVYK